MNERIKKLLAQAHLECGPDTNKVAERYAELIVRECIKQCADDESSDEWDKGVRWAANQIKQHFGIES